jgi:hypothetical protein
MKRSTCPIRRGGDGGCHRCRGVVRRGPSAQSTPLPFTFYLTHYELLGDPDDPSGVRYHSSGRPFAKARDGSRIILTGQGGWDPASARATGGGEYTIRDHAKAALS